MNERSLKTDLFNAARLILRNRFAESVLIPFTKGKKWDQFISRVPANYYQYKKGSVRKVQRDGFVFELDISDYMQWLIYFGILAEPRQTLYDLVSADSTVLDIGANIGETTLAFSKLTGEKGKVYAFEPDPDTYEKLERHVALNHCSNVQLINAGLGSSEAEVILESNENNSGGNRISSAKGIKGKKIHIITLDEFVKNKKLKLIHLIKIDVEGYEFFVLKGAEKTIENLKPVLFIEVVDDFLKNQGSSAEELVSFLISKNYKLKNANDGTNVTPKTDFINSHFDIIARPNEY